MNTGWTSVNPTTTQSRNNKLSWDNLVQATLGMVGWAMNRLHSPAKIREFEYVDPVSDQTVYLSTGARYSVLHIGSLRLFFDRATGKFDGTCRSLEERVESGLELFD
jgi:hypothetical protein